MGLHYKDDSVGMKKNLGINRCCENIAARNKIVRVTESKVMNCFLAQRRKFKKKIIFECHREHNNNFFFTDITESLFAKIPDDRSLAGVLREAKFEMYFSRLLSDSTR